MRRRLLLALPLGLGGCALLRRRRKPVAPVPEIHAVLGPPYQAGGIWRYPRASYDYDQTGLAVVAQAHPPYATDGAPWDAEALLGAHPTLQLPAVARVTNLETGRQILLRLDDRGPASPARLLAVTPRAALLLGPGTLAGVLRVRVQVEEAPSRQLTAQFGDPDAPALAVTAAPAEAVRAEALSPPAGAHGQAGFSPRATEAGSVTSGAAVVPLRLPEAIVQLPIRPTQLWIDAGGLSRPRAAEILRDRLRQMGAIVVFDPRSRPEEAYRVRIGPLPDVATADDTLDRALRSGVVGARIILQ